MSPRIFYSCSFVYMYCMLDLRIFNDCLERALIPMFLQVGVWGLRGRIIHFNCCIFIFGTPSFWMRLNVRGGGGVWGGHLLRGHEVQRLGGAVGAHRRQNLLHRRVRHLVQYRPHVLHCGPIPAHHVSVTCQMHVSTLLSWRN